MMFLTQDLLLLNTNYYYYSNYNVFVAYLVLIMSHFVSQFASMPLICNVPAAITLICFSVPSSLPIKILTLFIDAATTCAPHDGTVGL